MKKLLAFLLALMMLFSLVACSGSSDDTTNDTSDDGTQDQTDDTEEKIDPSKIIDIYIIAGQSNAVGHTKLIGSAYESYVKQSAPELAAGGYDYVHYAGNSRTDKNNHTELVNNDKPWQKVTFGLGSNANNIGPEAGMAKALSKCYNEESGRNAGIIKFAHGGTSIRDLSSGSNQFGNWVSPSYAKAINASYKDTDVNGALYRGLLEQVKRNVSELKEYGGYEKINIRGLYWMQGESDRHQPDVYKTAFTYFVEDLRKDLSEIMLEFTNGETDCGASEMGIFVGAISKGYNIAQPADMATNTTFINMQKQLAEDIEKCYFVDNSGYAITKWDSSTSDATVLGSDAHHWNAKDMFAIGNLVGKTMFNECVKNGSTK